MTRDEALRLAGFKGLLDRILSANQALIMPQGDADPLVSFLYSADPKLALFKNQKSEFYLFDGSGEYLALCSDAELERLCLYLGASVYARVIAAVVLKAQKTQLLEAVGSDVYRFVMDYARYSVPALKLSALNLELPSSQIADLLYRQGRSELAALAQSFAQQRVKELFLKRLAAEDGDPPAKLSLSKTANLSREALIREDPLWMQYFS